MEITKEINTALGTAINLVNRAVIANNAYESINSIFCNHLYSDVSQEDIKKLAEASEVLSKLKSAADIYNIQQYLKNL